jgi:hypothetical protein
MYFSTTQSYTYLYKILIPSEKATTTMTYSDTYSLIISIIDTMTNMDTFIDYETYVQYSTITRLLAPSPSILPKDKCTCVFKLCNKIDLVLLTINNIV